MANNKFFLPLIFFIFLGTAEHSKLCIATIFQSIALCRILKRNVSREYRNNFLKAITCILFFLCVAYRTNHCCRTCN